MSTTPRIGVRPSQDRESVVIVYGDETDVHYYATFTPEQAHRIAAAITKVAREIVGVNMKETLQ